MMPKHKPNAITICSYCGEEFKYYSAPSIIPRMFCGPICRNKARTKPPRLKTCPICGKEFESIIVGGKHWFKITCSQSCAGKLNRENYYRGGGKVYLWTPDKKEFLFKFYPEHGAEWCSKQLGLTMNQIHGAASRYGLKLSPEATRTIVNNAAREYMLSNNPMKNPAIVAKVNRTLEESGKRDGIFSKLVAGRARVLREKPSKTQLRLKYFLDSIGISAHHEYIIKEKFTVDFAIPESHLIIQVDGCYWHGHICRGKSLTPDQVNQQKRDAAQDKYLVECGWRVIRFWECDINNKIDWVLDSIQSALYNG